MEGLQLNLFGKPEVILNGVPVTAFESAKSPALLAYLAVTGQAHSRDTLATLLWGDLPEATAKRNLTKALTNLRQLLEPYLLIERHSIAFNHQAHATVDAVIFQAAVEGSALLEPDNPERDLAPLRQAVSLYRGDFLAGFYVKNALEFEEWVLGQREYLRELMMQALQRLTEQSARLEADPAIALEYCRRWLGLEAWQEAAHRQMMLLLARNGQRDAALAQYETCRRILAEELGVEPMAETTALYQRLQRSLAPLPHNLPSQPNTFVGRVREMNQLTTHLDNPDCRLLTLVGLGGIGKTRLAVEGSRRYVQPDQALGGATFSEGIYLVNLAPLTLTGITNGETSRLSQISNLVASAIADILEFSFHGPTDLMAQLLNYLREKEMLLILDNFEHLIEGAGLLAELLQRTSHLKLLVTSRERLNLMEEWVMEIEGLEYPKEDWGLDNERISPFQPSNHYSAVALFIGQAQQAQVDFTLSKTEIPHIVRLCQLVEGIPLALVLVANWLRVLTCAEIVQEIEQNLDFLTATHRNIPERHRSLRAVFEQSWQMLSAQEQAVLRKITVFRGGFRRETAQEVAGASLVTLAGLVDKSLLRLTPLARYEIHELVRQYAAEKLAQTLVEQEATQDAHCRYYARFLQACERQLAGLQGVATLTELSQEGDNIRACWYQTLVPGRPVAVTEMIQCTWSLIFLYAWRGWYQEGVELFGRAVARLEEEKALTPFSPQKNLAYGKVLLGLGDSYHLLGNLKRATELYQQSLLALQQSSVESLDATRDQGLAFHLLGAAAWQQGRYTEAEKSLNQGLALFKVANDPIFEARSTLFLGIIAYELGEYLKAEQLLQEGLQVFKNLGEYWYATEALVQLARVSHTLGKPLTEIRQLAQENLRLSRETESVAVIVEALNVLGTILNLMGSQERVEAKQLLQESVALCRELNDPAGMAHALHQLGLTLTALGDYQTAAAYFREALEISISSQFLPMTLEILVGLATLWVKQQSLSEERQETLLTLTMLVFNHVASNRQAQDRVVRLLAELEEVRLPPEIITAAKERAQTMTLEAMVHEILSESTESV